MSAAEDCDYYLLYKQDQAPNIGEVINKALEKIEDPNCRSMIAPGFQVGEVCVTYSSGGRSQNTALTCRQV